STPTRRPRTGSRASGSPPTSRRRPPWRPRCATPPGVTCRASPSAPSTSSGWTALTRSTAPADPGATRGERAMSFYVAASPPGDGAAHPVDEVLPPAKLGIYGAQHVLAFYAGAVIVPILLAGAIGLRGEDLVYLISADLFTCGIASIIQAVGFWKVGVRLPL